VVNNGLGSGSSGGERGAVIAGGLAKFWSDDEI
jgi:hypothetical protein